MNITGGKYNNIKLVVPNENIARPTLSKVRMGVFNTLYSLLDFENKSFLDVFGGSGIMGLEAISRGFEKVLVLENNKSAAEVIKKNYEKLGLEVNIKVGDSIKILKNLKEKFDVVYVDPPYKSDFYEKVFLNLSQVINSETIIITESNSELYFDTSLFKLLKTKKYGDKYINFFILNNLKN